jgi:hypothetical protein
MESESDAVLKDMKTHPSVQIDHFGFLFMISEERRPS